MKKLTQVLIVCGLMAAAVSPASAGLGGFGGLGGLGGGDQAKSDGGDVDTQVKDFNAKSNDINGLVFVSLKSIMAAYATDEESAKIAEQVKAYNSNTNAAEKRAQVKAAIETDAAAIQKLTQSKDAETQTKNLSKAKQTQVTAGVGNFLIAGLRAVQLSETGQTLIQSASSNPMNMSKIISVKDSLPVLLSAASTSAKVIPEFVKVLKGAKIQVAEVKADSKPSEATF